jgi:demethylmenaquinone methyltransferase / 2-methoxy-6-polyprenyl-1,4-benzoquinol methylase
MTPETEAPRTRRAGQWEAMLPSAPWRERRKALRDLFEGIAPTYDRLNRVLSLGIDASWRARAAREAVARTESGVVLDLASGTGDQAVSLLRHAPRLTVLRLDLSAALLLRAARKLEGAKPGGPLDSAPALVAEMERLPIREGSCEAVTMAFALRHVEGLGSLMEACARVLRPGGRVAFVDMAIPERGVWGGIYRVYFRRVLPLLAQLFGGDREAYELMVRSVAAFPGWDALAAAARGAGLDEVRSIRLTGGAARVFIARKRSAAPERS